MVKPNDEFKLTIKDIDLIEKSLYNMVTFYSDKQDFDNVKKVTELLGKIHNQKQFYRPNKGTYVSG